MAMPAMNPATTSSRMQCASWSARQHQLEPCIASLLPLSPWWPGSMRISSRSRNSRCACQLSDQEGGSEGSRILDMKSLAAKRLEEQMSCSKLGWEAWLEHFRKVEEEANLIQALKFQLDEAIKLENFQDAARLKAAIEAAESRDVIRDAMQELEVTLEEEQYSSAALLRDKAGLGLLGWWSGLSKDGIDDPFGRIIKVRTGHGKLVAEGYSARQLATASEGSLLFEVYVKKSDDRTFSTQAVYIQRDERGHFDIDEIAEQVMAADIDVVEEEDSLAGNEQASNDETDEASSDEMERKNEGDEAKDSKKVIHDIVSFLKDRIPELGMKVIKVVTPEEIGPDVSKIIKEIVGKGIEEDLSQVEAGIHEVEATAVRVVVGADKAEKSEDTRMPAIIQQTSRDSFLFQVDSLAAAESSKASKIAAEAVAEQLPNDVAKILSKATKRPVKVKVSHAVVRPRLPQNTVFRRINAVDSSDPFSGLYIGSFGSHAPQVFQLQRKFGHWDTGTREASEEYLRFYEYVEAVKLTGDFNVPAGQVSFRARVGKEHSLSPYGVYPEELGVIARFKGEGQLAEPGYKNPRWTEGELVLLNGKAKGPTGGAKLGFVFCLPDHHFLILFDKLNLKL